MYLSRVNSQPKLNGRRLGRARLGHRSLRGLGVTSQESGLFSTGAAVGTTIGVSSLAAGTAIGSFAGPIGAGVGALVGVITGLFAASAQRAKGAKSENAAVNEFLPAFDQSMQAIFQAANAGTISAQQAIPYCQQALSAWWSSMAPYQSGPGRADASHGGSGCAALYAKQSTGKNQCNKSCTAGCCVGCMDLYPGVLNAIAVFTAGGGTAQFPQVFGSGYGATGRAAYALTYTPPAPTTAAANTVSSALGISSTTTVAGIPEWLLFVGGAGLALFFALR